ncbi:MAG: Mg-dependent DNase [Parcubacteria group bacterium Athens1014_10]|nr:MAG: Mg-dependent DNase [Parcubacteria group bacterium Athens1014_10]
MIDTHSHLNFNAFKKDCAQVIGRSFSNGIKAIINVGSDLETSKRAIELADEFENLYAAIGLHPVDTGREVFDFEIYKKMAGNKKAVAIGETGLDYFHVSDPKLIVLQKEVFLSHIKLARELDLPLILHCRGNKQEPYKPYYKMLEILKKEKEIKGVIHCFSADLEIAKNFLELGFYIGFTGVITFAKGFDEIIKELPSDKILTETD